MQQFYDTVKPKNIRHTADGYLVADASVARSGVQLYRGAELGKPEVPFVRVYRPSEEVFSKDAMHSYAHRPMTNEHPKELVDSTTWKDVAIGQTGDEVVRDGETVRVPLLMMDQTAIDDFNNGKRELSMGYTAMIDWDHGFTDDGLEYDAIQRELRMNHLALVIKGRAGNARIGDGLPPEHKQESNLNLEGQQMAEQLKQVIIDGLTIETTNQGAQAIEKLQAQLSDASSKVTSAEKQHAEEIALKDTELAKKDAEIGELKGKVLSDSEVDELVKSRASLVSIVAKIDDSIDCAGKTESAIRAEVVRAKFGDGAVEGKSEAYIEARFDTAAEAVADANPNQPDPVRASLANSAATVKVVDADSAYDKYVGDLSSGSYHSQKA